MRVKALESSPAGVFYFYFFLFKFWLDCFFYAALVVLYS